MSMVCKNIYNCMHVVNFYSFLGRGWGLGEEGGKSGEECRVEKEVGERGKGGGGRNSVKMTITFFHK